MDKPPIIHSNYLEKLPENEKEEAKIIVDKAIAAGYYDIGLCDGWHRVYNDDGQYEDEKGKYDYEPLPYDIHDLVGVNPQTKQMAFLASEFK